MSNDSWTDPQSASPTPVKKGMSGCMLASIIVGGLGLVCVLACCGVGIWAARNFAPKIVTSPADVTAVGHQILNIDVPPDFTPYFGMTMDVMVVVTRQAKFRHKEGKGELQLISFKVNVADPNQQGGDPSAQLRMQAQTEVLGGVDVKTTEAHDITINGQKVSASIGTGTERSTGKPVHTLTVDFDQSVGKTIVLLRLDDDVWDEEAILKMLEEAKP